MSAEEVFIPNAMTSGATGLPLSVCAKGGKEMLHKAVSSSPVCIFISTKKCDS